MNNIAIIISTILASALITFSHNTYSLTAEQYKEICRNDMLLHAQAWGRNNWDLACNRISERDKRYHTVDDEGRLRLAVLYRSYYNPSNLLEFRAPTNANASCDLREFTESIVCSSFKPSYTGPGYHTYSGLLHNTLNNLQTRPNIYP